MRKCHKALRVPLMVANRKTPIELYTIATRKQETKRRISLFSAASQFDLAPSRAIKRLVYFIPDSASARVVVVVAAAKK